MTEPYGFISKPFEERELFVMVEFTIFKHQMIAKIEEKRDWYQDAILSIPYPLIALDRNNEVIILNKEGEILLGLKEYLLKGKSITHYISDFKPWNPKNEPTGQSEKIKFHLNSEWGSIEKYFYIQFHAIKNDRNQFQGTLLLLSLA